VIRLLLQGNLQGEDELLSPFFLLGYDGLNCSRFLDSRAAAPYNPKREDERGIESHCRHIPRWTSLLVAI
jgi:hypothetical protein